MPVPRRVAGALLLVALSGCGDKEASTAGWSASTPPLFVNNVSNSDDGAAAEIEGSLSIRSGCLWVGDYRAVWPRGTSWDGATRTLQLPNDDTVTIGTKVAGGGAYVQLDHVASEFGDEMRNAISRCEGDEDEIAVFNNGAPIVVVAE